MTNPINAKTRISKTIDLVLINIPWYIQLNVTLIKFMLSITYNSHNFYFSYGK